MQPNSIAAKLPPKGSRTDWIADKALRGLIQTVMRLPYATRVPMMGSTLSRAIGPLAGYLRRADENLALIYPNMDAAKRREIAQAVCDNFGRTLIENYSWREFGRRLTATPVQGNGLPHLEKAKSEKRPVIFVTGHFGNHEAPRHVLSAMGYTIGGLYRPMSNPYFNDHYAKTMTAWGGPVFEQGSRGTIGFARHLRAGGMATLLFDVAVSDGASLRFMGRDARTATSAANLALKFDALVLPYFGVRKPDGLNFEIYLEDPIAPDTPIAMMANMTERLELRVNQNPEQWFWVHRRWKQGKVT